MIMESLRLSLLVLSYQTPLVLFGKYCLSLLLKGIGSGNVTLVPTELSEDVLSNIKLRGHKIIYRGGYIGESNGIMITSEGLFGGGDCRGETSAIGY